MILRDAGGVVLSALFVLGAAIQCGPDWAHLPASGDPPRTPAISAEQREQTFTLLSDALLDATDVPAGMQSRANGIEHWVPAGDAFLDAGGWLAVSGAWLHGTHTESISDSRYAFADDAGAASYIDDLVASLDGGDEQALADLPPGVVGFSRTFQIYDRPVQREVELATQQGRVLISLSVVMAADSRNWRDESLALLQSARSRTSEALAAAR